MAALNPNLVGASTVMLLLPNPPRLMLGYLLGALMTSITPPSEREGTPAPPTDS